MSIRFKPGQRPSQQEYLDQAAGVGVKFIPGSENEFFFLQFCELLYSHGYQTGVEVLYQRLRENQAPKKVTETSLRKDTAEAEE